MGEVGEQSREITLFSAPDKLRSDALLIERAIREGWDVPAHSRQLAPAHLVHLITAVHPPEHKYAGKFVYKPAVRLRAIWTLSKIDMDNWKKIAMAMNLELPPQTVLPTTQPAEPKQIEQVSNADAVGRLNEVVARIGTEASGESGSGAPGAGDQAGPSLAVPIVDDEVA